MEVYNPYYAPNKWGLEIVAVLERPDLSYEFDILIVFRHEDGRLFAGHDTGCSCPSPFENVRSLDDLILVKDLDDALSLIPPFNHYRATDVIDFVRKVREAL